MRKNTKGHLIFLSSLCIFSIICVSYHKLKVVFGHKRETNIEKQVENQSEVEEVVASEEHKQVENQIKAFIEDTCLEGITPIDITLEGIEKDHYGKYLTSMKVLGVNKEADIGVYEYYIMIQEDSKGVLEPMPLGVEVVISNNDYLEGAIVKTMMKIINGWDASDIENENIK